MPLLNLTTLIFFRFLQDLQDMIDFLGWLMTIVMCFGSVGIAHKRVTGLWMMLVGNVGFMVVGAATGLSSLVGVSLVMALLDLYAIAYWSRDDG